MKTCTCASPGRKNIPTVSARLIALGLMAYGHESLYELAASRRRTTRVGAEPSGPSRLDLAVDFQGHQPTLEEMESALCRASFRPVYPSRDDPQTFQFGKGSLVERVYNKTEEIKKTGKDWMRTVWAQHPDYDPEQPVWRFEVQLRRATLREFGCSTVEQTFAKPSGLLGFGLCWVSPRVPVETNLARCPVQPWWEELGKASLAGVALPRVKQERRACSFQRLVPQALGLLVSGAAHAGVTGLRRSG